MNRERSELLVGLTILAALGIFLYSTFRVGGCTWVERPGLRLAVRFDDAAGVQPRTEVLIAGVRVGEVERVDLEAGRARLTLRIEAPDVALPIDSTVSIRSRGLLGERVVEIAPGQADRFASPGDMLTRTEEAPNLDELLDRLAVISEDIREITRSFRLVLGGPEGEESLAGIVEDVRSVARTMREMVEDNDERFTRVMANLDQFASDLARITDDNGQTLGDLLESFSTSSQKMQTAIDDLAKVSARVERGEGTLGKLIADDTLYNDAQASLTELRAALREVRRAAEEAQEQLPVTVLGSVVGTLF